MTVYVSVRSEANRWNTISNRSGLRLSYMWASSEDELHQFANGIGITDKFRFNEPPLAGWKHYLISGVKKREAISAGAVLVPGYMDRQRQPKAS